MVTTLLTAVGSASASAALQSLRALGHRVVGCDIYPKAWNVTSGEVDAFFQSLPATDADAYVEQMAEAVQREGVRFLFPLTDVEVDVLCPHAERFARLGCALCVPPLSATRLCRDKLAMAKTLNADGVYRPIPTRSPYGWSPEERDFPLMLKPQSGRSSQGQLVVATREAFDAALNTRADYIAQPYLSGDVFTVDVARDCFGAVRALARHELLRTSNGLGTTVRVLPNHPLERACAEIAARAGIVGVVNMEFIEHDGVFWFLEVNPRFSGGVGFSVRAGVDFPALAIRCYAGEALGDTGVAREMTLTRRVELICTEQ